MRHSSHGLSPYQRNEYRLPIKLKVIQTVYNSIRVVYDKQDKSRNYVWLKASKINILIFRTLLGEFITYDNPK